MILFACGWRWFTKKSLMGACLMGCVLVLLWHTAPASLTRSAGMTSSQLLAPVTLTAVRGEHSDIPLTVLSFLEMQDWNDEPKDAYVEFYVMGNGYEGIFTYRLPSALSPSDVKSLRVHINQRGPTRNVQRWWWELRDFQSGAWVEREIIHSPRDGSGLIKSLQRRFLLPTASMPMAKFRFAIRLMGKWT